MNIKLEEIKSEVKKLNKIKGYSSCGFFIDLDMETLEKIANQLEIVIKRQ